MAAPKRLKPVRPLAGKPLYEAVKLAITEAIETGIFHAGDRLPSTKELSVQLEVSLVTAHRALQELVSEGMLERSQGRGTFVHHRHAERRQIAASSARVGLVFHAEASLAD